MDMLGNVFTHCDRRSMQLLANSRRGVSFEGKTEDREEELEF